MSTEKNKCKAINNNKKKCSFNCVDNSEYCSRHIKKLDKPKNEIKICKAKNQKKEQCPWKAIDGEIYCKRHLNLLGNNKEGESKYCSGCKNYLPMSKWGDVKLKTCLKCNSRANINRTKNKEKRKTTDKICIGYTQTKILSNDGEIVKKKCSNYANKKCKFPEYCGEHQTLAKKISLEVDGKLVCSNWVRNCFNTFEKEKIKGHFISKCEECRTVLRKSDNDKYHYKKNKAIEFNKNNKIIFMCYSCNDEVKINTVRNNKCIKCNELQNNCEKNRHINEPLKKRLVNIKKAKYNNRKIEISDEEIMSLIIKKCHYCNDDNGPFGIGIDRIDSSKEYISGNCVPCCEMCNRMKSNYDINKFLKIIKYLVRINEFTEKKPNDKYKKLFECCKNPLFKEVGKDSSDDKPKPVGITKKIWKECIVKPCFYCKNNFNNKGASGIDRIDSRFGYFENNIVPACGTCNKMKNIMLPHEFYNKIKKIYRKHIGFIDEEPTIREKILQGLNKNADVSITKHKKFLMENAEQYDKLIFNPKTIEEVKNIKILLEFCDDKNNDSKKLKDLWNYFRHTTSSLEFEKNKNLIGRRIFILIKDKTSNKYLGVMSLSSDIYSLKCKDDLIEWSKEEKDKKMEHIMNLTTCVPLQPFGYNFNGGKLLACLAFSKEVVSYYKNKYKESDVNDLLGIVTTSLHGKSIMYDRLKCLKFIGYTKGFSTCKISEQVINDCKKYIKNQKNKIVDTKKKLFYVKETLRSLGISEKHMTSNPKGVYIGFTHDDSKDYLNGKIDKIPKIKKNLSTAQETFDEWVNRWATQRCAQLKLKNNFKDNNIKNEDEDEDKINSTNIVNDEIQNISRNNT